MPKYGSGGDSLGLIARDLFAFWVNTAAELPTASGSAHKAKAISMTWDQAGALTSATPGGPARFPPTAPFRPCTAGDIHGPTAVLRSALKIEHGPDRATLMNMKFHPGALETGSDLEKLAVLLRTDLGRGGEARTVSRDDAEDAVSRSGSARRRL